MHNEYLSLIKKAGLNEGQAKLYLALIEEGPLGPMKLAELTGESRENCYNIAKKLADLNLIEKTDDKKTSYRALNPSALEVLAEKRRKIIQKNELQLKSGIDGLISLFYESSEMPGARTLTGIEGIKEAYRDALREGKDVYLVRTVADVAIGVDEDSGSFLHNYRERLPKLGIHTYGLTPDNEHARKLKARGRDEEINFHRTFMPSDAYTASVAIHVYGNKLAFIAFGESMMTTIIASPAIAEAMRQIHGMLVDYYSKNYPQ